MHFSESIDGAHTGISRGGREWRIYRVPVGWRLEFHDPGDVAPTQAGVYGTVEAAMAEAAREPGKTPRSR
jgi:hypothetical protein